MAETEVPGKAVEFEVSREGKRTPLQEPRERGRGRAGARREGTKERREDTRRRAGIKRACAPGPRAGSLEEARREAAPRTSQRPGRAMEPGSDLGLGDSPLHRYLDGEFWSLKNELRRVLGGCPLFRHRYRGRPSPRPWPAGRVPSVSARPCGHHPSALRPRQGSPNLCRCWTLRPTYAGTANRRRLHRRPGRASPASPALRRQEP